MDETAKQLVRLYLVAKDLLDECDRHRAPNCLRTLKQKAVSKEIRRIEEMLR